MAEGINFFNRLSQTPKKVHRAVASKMNALQSDFFKYYKNLDGNTRTQIAESMPVMNPEGRMLSGNNTVFLAWQSDIKFTIVAGFKQWLKHGRCVKKGQHGNFIFIPALNKARNKNEDGSETVSEELERFLVATVFDISQTFEMKEQSQKQETVMSEVQEPNHLDYYETENEIDDDDERDLFEGWDPEIETDACGNCYSDADPGL